ncbi:hypothetical protein PILCRDRAFT_87786 [Piloderma croceum F 1598]|uniref:Uncharacterized protein n=1 Tax=Piloderma croceum (strain F 1598) TaxID=765440 RepID=A0A0C3FW55_PILCF|nr:hypothetical protein PILCRDRAFT_87786 [Piloderma croceum F 1598]
MIQWSGVTGKGIPHGQAHANRSAQPKHCCPVTLQKMSAPASTSSPRRSSCILKRTSQVSKNTTKPTGQPHRSRVMKNKPRPHRPTNAGPLYLRVNRWFLRILPAATAAQPNPQSLPPLPGTTGNLNVIIANLPDLRPFAGNMVDWLIKVARLIFEPLGTSSLYTFTTESLEWWLDREMEPTLWRPVVQGEQLRATIYEFRPNNNIPITLTRKSLRHMRSVTTNTSAPQATAFSGALLRRDQSCIITQYTGRRVLAASHLLPRRLGDLGVQSVIQRFTGPSTIVDRYDPALGVSLFLSLDAYVDTYEMGFWTNGPDQYVIHSFIDEPLNIHGGDLSQNEQALHGHQIALHTHDPSVALPLVGVFNWHYLQCVLKKFSTPAYQAIGNIQYFSLPFRTRDDDDESDVDFDDDRNVANPPYPSYLWELSELRACQHLEAVERNHAIATWNSGVSVP